ncbi:MAG: fatty acid desaturase [Verrucomicrobiaceae bacterium]|nr:fatty acid desaturase [Verrucomicrobiaceae bacterium]
MQLTADSANQEAPAANDWKAIVAKYTKPSASKAIWQVVNTMVPYVACWVAMYYLANISWWLVLPVAALAGALMVRMFILFHDCTHGSFFKSTKANNVLGQILGVLTFTPYYHWKWEHTVHHATSGNLDKRGMGDIWTLTIQEYLESSRLRRFAYRLARNPLVMFLLGPLFLFLVWNRITTRTAGMKERMSVYLTNLGIISIAVGMSYLFGWQNYIFSQFIVMSVAGTIGVWMFYVQHQFEGVYWERQEDWDFATAAMHGSSFYKLPKILQWFSGNIGFHHIHHLSSRIPNYHLEQCHKSEPFFQKVKPITLVSSLKCAGYRLWDEEKRELVGYKRLREVRRSTKAAA